MAFKWIERRLRRVIPRPIRRLATIAATIAAVMTGNYWLAAAIGATLFIKKPSMPVDNVLDRLNISINPQALGKWVFGETALASDVLYAEKIGEDRLVYLVAGAAHEITEYGALYLNDELISFSGANATGDWAGAVSVYRNLGTDPQSALSIPGSALPSEARGEGIAHYAIDFNVKDQPKLADGIPTRITQVAKGAKVYDPRLDSTRGGTGSHRADDQSTWEYTNGTDIGANWALVVAHYLLGYRLNGKLIYGVGVNPDDVDWEQVAAMADVCDMTVDGLPKYRVGGIMPTNQEHAETIRQLEAAVGGKVAKVAGRYYIWCPHNDLSPVDTITDEDIIRDVGVTYSPSAPIQEIYNAIRGRYVEPDSLYQPLPYPEIEEPEAVEEDGRVRIKEHDFSIIQDVEIAQRVAREIIRRTRFSATWRFALGPVGMLYQPFDVLTLNIQETNNAPQLVRIINMQFSVGGAVLVECIEEDASIYDTTLPLGVPVTRLDPAAYDPTAVIPVTGLAAEDITINGSAGSVTDAIRVTWNDPGGFIRETQVRFRISGLSPEAEWQGVPPAAVDQTTAIIDRVESLTEYEIQARHVTLSGVRSPWVQVVETTGGGIFPPEGLQNRLVTFTDLTTTEHNRENDGNYISPVIAAFNVQKHEHFLTLSFEARSTGDDGMGDTQRLQAFFQQRINGGSWVTSDDAAAPPGTFFLARNQANPPNGDGSPVSWFEYNRHIDEFVPNIPENALVEYRLQFTLSDQITPGDVTWVIRNIRARIRQVYVGD